MIDVSLLMQRKVYGKSIQGHPALQRLVENRVILEKMRPIDQKLKYQIDKLVKIAKTGVMDASDPLRFRPNPDDLAAKFENEDSDEEDNEDQSKKSDSVYKAPKVAPVHYAGDETQKERQEKEMEKLKRRALSSTMIQEIRRDFLDEPEEVIESRDLHRVREDRKRKERTQFEEAYFTRVTVSKKDKEKSRRMSTMSSLDGVVKFDDLSYLDQEGDQVQRTIFIRFQITAG
ncbi:hypothetical protein C0Q70_19063 [Pomacea canaliculata]|uniref:Uncharacterized protein n=1 Tax=Pomacea canaliculata TaxID=400727 RepID=A0A2T7NI95_POMCA|nr:hypothetical protein C0Q70_19063 [Pomacea canaliculata]